MDTFVARQPIFDGRESVYGYELLFRSGLENAFTHSDPDQASAKVISDTLLLLGVDAAAGGKKAFVNVTRDVLLGEIISMLPREAVVVEVLETVAPDAEVIAACRKLKRAGYALALDDFRDPDRNHPLLDLADIVKVDFLATGEGERAALARGLVPRGIQCLAEKVETREVFREAQAVGYRSFQGYFFSRPVVMARRDVPGFKLNYLQILGEIHRTELDFRQMEKIIGRDTSLSYKLLRYLNSAFFGLRGPVGSIQHALLMLGEREVKKWVTLVALAGMAMDKPEELLIQALIRAKFCESLALRVRLADRAGELFLVGMFSLIDAMLDRPLPEILEGMPIAGDVKAALLQQEGPLRDPYDCALAYARGDWARLGEIAARLGIPEAETPPLYMDAVRWCREGFAPGLLRD